MAETQPISESVESMLQESTNLTETQPQGDALETQAFVGSEDTQAFEDGDKTLALVNAAETQALEAGEGDNTQDIETQAFELAEDKDSENVQDEVKSSELNTAVEEKTINGEGLDLVDVDVPLLGDAPEVVGPNVLGDGAVLGDDPLAGVSVAENEEEAAAPSAEELIDGTNVDNLGDGVGTTLGLADTAATIATTTPGTGGSAQTYDIVALYNQLFDSDDEDEGEFEVS